jgi:hypothetical protein
LGTVVPSKHGSVFDYCCAAACLFLCLLVWLAGWLAGFGSFQLFQSSLFCFLSFCFLTMHNFTLWNAATTFGEHGTTQYCTCHGNFFITWESTCYGKATGLKLNLHESTPIKFTIGATAAAGKTRGTYTVVGRGRGHEREHQEKCNNQTQTKQEKKQRNMSVSS